MAAEAAITSEDDGDEETSKNSQEQDDLVWDDDCFSKILAIAVARKSSLKFHEENNETGQSDHQCCSLSLTNVAPNANASESSRPALQEEESMDTTSSDDSADDEKKRRRKYVHKTYIIFHFIFTYSNISPYIFEQYNFCIYSTRFILTNS